MRLPGRGEGDKAELSAGDARPGLELEPSPRARAFPSPRSAAPT